MPDLGTNTTANANSSEYMANWNALQSNTISAKEMSAITTAMLTGEGIELIAEAYSEINPTCYKIVKSNKKPNLPKPENSYEDLQKQEVTISKEMAEILGLGEKEKVTYQEFSNTIFKKLNENKNNDKTFGLDNLNSEQIDLLCIILCHKSKSEIINTLKEVLQSKQAKRQNLSNEYIQKTNEAINENVELQKEAAEAKKTSLFNSIFSIVSAIISAIVAVAIAAVTVVFTAGIGSVAAGLLIAGAALAVISSIVSIAGSSCNLAALNETDPEKQDKLGSAALGLGIASAVIGIIACLCDITGGIKAAGKVVAEAGEAAVKAGVKAAAKSTGKTSSKKLAQEGLETGAKKSSEAVAKEMKNLNTSFQNLVKAVETGGDVITAITIFTQGLTSIYSGIKTMDMAEIEKELAELNISMTELDQVIAVLQSIIEGLQGDIQKFIEDLLSNEETFANALHQIFDVLSQLAQKTA